MAPIDELRARLDELGVEYMFDDSNDCEIVEWQGPYNLWWQFVYDPYEEEPYGELRLMETGGATHLTSEQAIAATVGNVGSANTEEVLRQLVAQLGDAAGFHFASKYVDCIVEEYAGKFATVGKDIERYDGSGRRGTVAILQGGRKPEEVLFVRDEGGVTHYLPEETCHMKLLENMHTSAYQDVYECDECGEQVLRETYMGKSEPPKFCPACGRKVIGIKEEAE